MVQANETASAKPSPARAIDLDDDPTTKNNVAVILALSQAFVHVLQLANRVQLDFWSGYLERVGIDRHRSAPRSTEENFLLQAAYVRAMLRAHTAMWSRLPVLSETTAPAVEVTPTQQRRAA